MDWMTLIVALPIVVITGGGWVAVSRVTEARRLGKHLDWMRAAEMAKKEARQWERRDSLSYVFRSRSRTELGASVETRPALDVSGARPRRGGP